MPSREDITAQILQIDQKMNEIIAQNPAAQTTYRHARFPLVSWVITLVLGGSYLFGKGSVPIPENMWEYQLYGAGVFGLYAILMTLKKVFNSNKTNSAAYKEMNETLVKLRQDKAALQEQLKSL